MKIENYVRLIAGSLVLLGILLGNVFSPLWDFLPLFVAVNLIQSPFTGFCGLEKILKILNIGNQDDSDE